MKYLFLIKMIEEQQKIRSVLKEFIPKVLIYDISNMIRPNSIAKDEVFIQLIGYFIYQILAPDIET